MAFVIEEPDRLLVVVKRRTNLLDKKDAVTAVRRYLEDEDILGEHVVLLDSESDFPHHQRYQYLL